MSITIEISAEQDDVPVRGNALDSGDLADDKACEDEILARLDNGDVWAWACVRVRVTCGDFSAEDSLGCCSYADESDFRAGPYYADMVGDALDSLQAQLDAAAKLAKTIKSERRDLLLAMTGKRRAREKLVFQHTDPSSRVAATSMICETTPKGVRWRKVAEMTNAELLAALPRWLRVVVPK